MRKGMSYREAGRLGWEKSEIARKIKKDKSIKEYYRDPKKCKCCGKIIQYDKKINKFCNRSCAAMFNNKSRAKLDKICAYCNSVLRLVKRRNKFCSTECFKKYLDENRLRKYKEGDVKDYGTSNANRVFKKILIKSNGNKCEICGISEWNKKQLVMIVDHMDGNPYNNDFQNLRLLCPNCDSQTDTYKGRNRGKGRISRRERYRSGKSF